MRCPELRSKTMKKLSFTIGILAAAFQAHATLDWYDSFNYSPTGVQLATAASPTWVAYTDGGVHATNFAGTWIANSSGGDNSAQLNGVNTTGVPCQARAHHREE